MSIFKPEDFVYGMDRAVDHRAELTANIANAKLAKLIDEAPVIYSEGVDVSSNPKHQSWSFIPSKFQTYSAKLMFITELLKKECEHEANVLDIHWKSVTCKHCGVEIKATWSPA